MICACHVKETFLNRGENGPGCWVMQSLGGDQNRCRFQWLLDTDIKGWMPRYVIDSAIAGTQMDYMKHLRKHAQDLKERGRLREFRMREEATSSAAAALSVSTEEEEEEKEAAASSCASSTVPAMTHIV
jgi:hypothetical protein